MAQETLNRIRETELQAKKIIEDAQASGAELLANAKTEAQQYRETLIAKCRADAKKALSTKEAGLDQELEKAGVRAEAVIGQFSKTLESKKAAAVQIVVESLI